MKKDKHFNFLFFLSGLIDIVSSIVFGYVFFVLVWLLSIIFNQVDKEDSIKIGGGRIVLYLICFACVLIFIFGIISMIIACKKKVCLRLPFAIVSIIIESACFGTLLYNVITNGNAEGYSLIFVGVDCLAPVLKIIALCLNRTEVMVIPNQFANNNITNSNNKNI